MLVRLWFVNRPGPGSWAPKNRTGPQPHCYNHEPSPVGGEWHGRVGPDAVVVVLTPNWSSAFSRRNSHQCKTGVVRATLQVLCPTASHLETLNMALHRTIIAQHHDIDDVLRSLRTDHTCCRPPPPAPTPPPSPFNQPGPG